MGKTLFFVLVMLSFSGCAHGKGFSLFKAQAAEEIKLADKVTGVESVKLADKAEAENLMGANQRIKKTQTSVGGNQTVQNDTGLMEDVLETYKDQTETHMETLWKIIYVLVASLGGALVSLISLVIWVIKFLLRRDADADEFMQEQINRRRV